MHVPSAFDIIPRMVAARIALLFMVGLVGAAVPAHFAMDHVPGHEEPDWSKEGSHEHEHDGIQDHALIKQRHASGADPTIACPAPVLPQAGAFEVCDLTDVPPAPRRESRTASDPRGPPALQA